MLKIEGEVSGMEYVIHLCIILEGWETVFSKLFILLLNSIDYSVKYKVIILYTEGVRKLVVIIL